MGKLIVRCLVAALLLIPFLLREGFLPAPTVEIFPALLFPSGKGMAAVDGDDVIYTAYEISSVDSNGKTHRLDPRLLFQPLPSRYWIYLASDTIRFGLADAAESAVEKKVGSWTLSVTKSRTLSDREQAEVIAWFQKRLEAVGRGGDVAIRVQQVERRRDSRSQAVIDDTIRYSYDIQVDG